MHSRSFVIAISILIFVSFEAHAGTATQTDWSGGDGIFGPVIDWGNEFYTDIDVECYITSSNIFLQKTMSLVPLEHTVDVDFDGAFSVVSTDINGDGWMDVLGAAYSAGDITWWENVDGSGTSWAEHTVDGDFKCARSVYSADVNGDGYMDVLGAAQNDNDITWWENMDGSGTSWTEHIIDGDFGEASSVYAADVNGDSYMDVLGAARLDNDITWWENMNGSGTSWTEHSVERNFYAAISVYSVDINGDGYMDVLGASNYLGGITCWENDDGSGTSWTEHCVDANFSGANCVYSEDVNADGYMDVLGAAYHIDEIAWWENMDGSGTSWTEHCVDSTFDGAYSVYSADINKDGYMDILEAAFFAGEVVWWENSDTAPGIIWTEHIVCGDFDLASSVYSADVNGDGYMDVLGTAFAANDITWWDLSEYLPDGSLESSVLDVQENPDWQTIDWTCTEPAGTDVALQVRASDNSSSMGVWSDTLTVPCTLDGILSDEDNYFQYRAILNTTDSLITPVLHDVTVSWNPVGIEGESEFNVYSLHGAQPNPAFKDVRLVFSLPVDSQVELTVYDLTGRMIQSINGEYEQGVHEVMMDDLACGVYFVQITSEEFAATQHFVVIK